MKRCLPLAVSILANLGGGAAGIGIAYLLGHVFPAFWRESRPLEPRLFAALPARLGCAVSPLSTARRPLPGLPPLWPCRGGRALRYLSLIGILARLVGALVAGVIVPLAFKRIVSARRKNQRPPMPVTGSTPLAAREPMSSVDRAWLMMDDPTNPMVINGFWIFEELLPYERVLAVLEERLLIHARFRQRVVEHRGLLRTRACWELDPAFDLRAHVGRIVLPEPGDRQTLNETVARLLSAPLDLNRPLWKFTLIEGYGGGSVFFGRIHHCIGDGAALVRVLLSLADDSAEGVRRAPAAAAALPQEESPPRPLPRAAARPGAATLPQGRRRGRHPANLLSLAARGAQLAGKVAAVLAKLALMRTDDSTAFKGAVGVGKAVAWSRGIPLDDVKFVKNTLGATVNDVLVAAMAGACAAISKRAATMRRARRSGPWCRWTSAIPRTRC